MRNRTRVLGTLVAMPVTAAVIGAAAAAPSPTPAPTLAAYTASAPASERLPILSVGKAQADPGGQSAGNSAGGLIGGLVSTFNSLLKVIGL